MPSKQAIYVAAQCWCDPRVGDREMDSELATVFAEKLDDYIAALQWCGGSPDFNEGGRARIGWEKVVKPLLDGTTSDIEMARADHLEVPNEDMD